MRIRMRRVGVVVTNKYSNGESCKIYNNSNCKSPRNSIYLMNCQSGIVEPF